jgi:hypothetical protein
MQVDELKAHEKTLQGLGVADALGLVLRLTQIEAELANCVARSSDLESTDSELTKFYIRVVALRRAAETAMHAQEAR